MPVITSTYDSSLRARVLSSKPLRYAEGAALLLDRPAHARAASALTAFGEWLAVVQDDANFLALVHRQTGEVAAMTLPPGAGGRRQFDDTIGNKHLKLDLEAGVTLPVAGREVLVAFGSGSSKARENIVLIESPTALRIRHCPALYDALRAEIEFAGSELNVEGAIYENRHVRLFNRGNGAPRGGLQPINATVDLDWEELLRYLEDPEHSAIPAFHHVAQYELGQLGGNPLGFTDAVCVRNCVFYSAAAERSPDVLRDGPVTGSAIGVVRRTRARWAQLETADGKPFDGKVEGITHADGGATSIARTIDVLVVVDRDDPGVPSELCRVRLSGPWM